MLRVVASFLCLFYIDDDVDDGLSVVLFHVLARAHTAHNGTASDGGEHEQNQSHHEIVQ